MSLGKKTLALFLVLGCAICLGSYLALRLTVLPAFAEFERGASEQALERVTRTLDSDLRALEIMNLEYSAWNDTYNYAQGLFPEYEDENLDPSYWHAVDINMMLIFDATGRPLFGRIGDPADGQRLPLTDELVATLRPGHPLITHETISSAKTGLLRTGAGIMQVASYPILTGLREGPITGAFIVGQFLTEERIAAIGERATVEFYIHTVDDVTLPAHVTAALRSATNTGVDDTITANAENVHGYKYLPDVLGESAVVLEVRQPRTITQIGIKTIRTAMTFLVVGSVGFLLAALFFLQQLIVKPVRVLTEKILNIQTTGELEVDVEVHRSDEVGVLAGKFAELTAGLGKARHELENARDEALSMSDAKSEFLARMSHEIRTPMNGVLGMTELLRNTSLSDKQERFAATIHQSAESLLHIINDILDISKIEAGKFELDVAPFNLRNVVEECLDLIADSAHRKGLELIGIIPAETHTGIEGDALRLRQVLVNLLSNAVKFTERGEITLRVSEVNHGEQEVRYRIEVEDTGIGINPKHLDAVFEPFTQEDGSTTRRFGGTGLGLSICRQLIELMGGEIGVESRPGMGCTFWIEVSFTKSAELLEPPTPEMLSGRRVLIVDDNATNLETLQAQLENWHMRVATARSGAEAIGMLTTSVRDNTPFETVLLDMNMPEMDGIELANEIRQTRGYKSAPLIMLSSVAISDVRERRENSVLDAWLTKPVRQARLCDALVSHLGRDAVSANPAAQGQVSSDATNDRENRSLRILLAEDNEVNKIVATSMLDNLGHRAIVVSNGAEAIDAFKKEQFDVVIMDCQMPVVDGFEATSFIRRWESEQGREPSPIIALTAKALDGDRETCLDAGMSDYVSKPFSLEQLAQVLARNVSTPRDPANESADRRARILVVDDNSINQQVSEALLNDLGYECDVAADGDAALQAMASTEYDLVLMDCHMPVRNGYDATRQIRRLEQAAAAGSHIPIVALTADLMQNNRERCLQAGMDDYLPKPFTQEQLQLVVARWLPGGAVTTDSSEIGIDDDGFTEMTDSISISALDRGALDEILHLDSSANKNIAREILISYCALSTRLVLQLRTSIADGDYEQTELIAHSLKGCSGQIGAVRLADLCETVLGAVRSGDLGDAQAVSERVAIEHSAILIALDKEVQRIAA
jgi:CheY-like chemotaxis protein/signal transduction histidine kinase/HPt (histidine-containing phosphotransfer) domain-containing protein